MPAKTDQRSRENILSEVRKHYGKIAQESGGPSSCCGPAVSSCGCAGTDASDEVSIVSEIYDTSEVMTLPEDVTGMSLGCGDPVTLATLKQGQTMVDLGSGGGIDCFLAARQVGESGRVIGVDMTAKMIEKAWANQEKMDAKNVEFRLGEIEHLPVEDGVADVVISNCVINLSPDKPQVFREAFRVLKPGGRLAVSDIVTDGPLPQEIKDDLSAWAGCVGGALESADYIAAIEAAGFIDVELKPTYFDREFIEEAAKAQGIEIGKDSGAGSQALAMNLEDGTLKAIDLKDGADLEGRPIQEAIFSARITARKPDKPGL